MFCEGFVSFSEVPVGFLLLDGPEETAAASWLESGLAMEVFMD